jgi:hypothetical protein
MTVSTGIRTGKLRFARGTRQRKVSRSENFFTNKVDLHPPGSLLSFFASLRDFFLTPASLKTPGRQVFYYSSLYRLFTSNNPFQLIQRKPPQIHSLQLVLPGYMEIGFFIRGNS